MSWVTNLMVSIDVLDNQALLSDLARWLEEEAPAQDREWRGVGSIREITNSTSHGWGGPKNPEHPVWAGTLNWADVPAVLAHIASMPWQRPESVQVFVCDQEDPYFRLYMIRGGEMRQFAPAPPPDDAGQLPW
jgi:hypothetical protein